MVAGPSSPYGRLIEIVGGDLPSFLSFRSAGGETWAMAGCRNDVIRLAYFSQRSGQTYPDRICRSSGCDVCECRVPLPERVQRGSPDRGVHHVFLFGESGRSCSGQRGVPRVIRERGPYIRYKDKNEQNTDTNNKIKKYIYVAPVD